MVTSRNCLRFWSEKCIKWVNSPLHCELLSTSRTSWERNVFRWRAYVLIMWENFGTKYFKCLGQKGPAAG